MWGEEVKYDSSVDIRAMSARGSDLTSGIEVNFNLNLFIRTFLKRGDRQDRIRLVKFPD